MTSMPQPIQEQRSRVFGSYRAEWLNERMFEFFAEPQYFPELTTDRPCLLLGGRGTGKTTVLRCLSYEGQLALKKSVRITDWPYYGLYYRVNTNRVAAFAGPELSPERWTKVFAHYINLTFCQLILQFLEWYNERIPHEPRLPEAACRRVAATLLLQQVCDFKSLAAQVELALLEFEAYINNVADQGTIRLSMQGAPIDTLIHATRSLSHFKDKSFFFLVDEYENFLDYQQRVVNTLIKHAGGADHPYTFKIGVRELGWRYRATLNENEQLISPADYVRINIADRLKGERFSVFARHVCNERIRHLKIEQGSIQDVTTLLPGLSENEEAERLDARSSGLLLKARTELEALESHRDVLKTLSPLEVYFIYYWSHIDNTNLAHTWQEFLADRDSWQTRFENYRHSLLYTLRRKKPGISKYYCGWEVFSQIAACNIRYVLELVDQCLVAHEEEGKGLDTPISYETQTKAAQGVGRKNLAELEGLTVHGAQLTKLLLGLGRIFNVLAHEPEGHAPEVTEFYLSPSSTDKIGEATDRLLNSAVMHLALLRFSGSKLAEEGNTRDYDYMVHPIFTPFFVFSYRRKRRMKLSGDHLLGLINHPKKAIDEVLGSHHRVADVPLPDQLLLFEGFYDAS